MLSTPPPRPPARPTTTFWITIPLWKFPHPTEYHAMNMDYSSCSTSENPDGARSPPSRRGLFSSSSCRIPSWAVSPTASPSPAVCSFPRFSPVLPSVSFSIAVCIGCCASSMCVLWCTAVWPTGLNFLVFLLSAFVATRRPCVAVYDCATNLA